MNLHDRHTVRDRIILCPRADGLGISGPNPVRRYMTRLTDKQAIMMTELGRMCRAGVRLSGHERMRCYNLVETYPILYLL